ncbi:hypothetical protein KIW84_021612 [Lathyrus oleraceus]|uniref:Association with the SNF1 complex (ASC) domain-containing protein n=1 Tax=Pisum sativum TaxID=3888 RepID=A0A9D5B5L3_PEA|nr:hypothetical protein KIW84_021612 [Pisum sativum]
MRGNPLHTDDESLHGVIYYHLHNFDMCMAENLKKLLGSSHIFPSVTFRSNSADTWSNLAGAPGCKRRSGKNFTILKDYVPEDIGSISGFEPPQSPTSSYDNSQLSSEDYAEEPPLVPPHFATTMLNVHTTNMEIQPPTPKPQHGVLNQLYIKKRVVTRWLPLLQHIVIWPKMTLWCFTSLCRRKSYTPMMKVTSLSTDYVDDATVIDDLIAKVREVPVKSATRIPDGADPV